MQDKGFILITGVNSDLGFSAAKELSKKHALILSGRNTQELEEIKSDLSNSKEHLIWEIDLTSDEIASNFLSFLNNNQVEISSFIHFAGYFKVTPLRLVKEEEVINSFKINVLSAIQIATVLAKKKYRKKLKDILFISSIASLRGKAGFSVYASAKSALSGLTKNLAIELAPVNVNQLVLGAVHTKKTKNLLDPIKEELDNHIPLQLGTTEQITKWIDFLINTDNKWVTGQEFVVDGGATVL